MAFARLREAWKGVERTWSYGAIRPWERIIDRYSSVGSGTFFDPALFPWVERLERDWRIIRGELDEVLRGRDLLPEVHEILEETARISRDAKWKTYYFYSYGTKFPRSCALCPRTTRILESLPGLKTAFFSILGPSKRIPRHRGPYKGVLRGHLALIVPEPAESCGIRVNEDTAHWTEGKCLVFDDTNEHEVWNDASSERVVLFLDMVRPLPFRLSVINALGIRLVGRTLVMRDLARNQREWEEKHLDDVAKVRSGRDAGSLQ